MGDGGSRNHLPPRLTRRWKGARPGKLGIIIEIVSPATVQKDMREKLFIYEKFGVKEYWIIHPVDQIVMVFKLLPGNKYGRPDIFSSLGQVKVGILPDLTIAFRASPVENARHTSKAAALITVVLLTKNAVPKKPSTEPKMPINTARITSIQLKTS